MRANRIFPRAGGRESWGAKMDNLGFFVQELPSRSLVILGHLISRLARHNCECTEQRRHRGRGGQGPPPEPLHGRRSWFQKRRSDRFGASRNVEISIEICFLHQKGKTTMYAEYRQLRRATVCMQDMEDMRCVILMS